MAYSWSKEDKFHYNKSEVMQELEKKVIETVQRAEILQEKIAQQEEAKAEARGAEEVAKAYEEATAAKENFNAAAHDEMTDEIAEDSLGDDLEGEVVDDLRGLVEAALKENNIKLAYRIERTIDEILEQDVACE